MTGEQQTADSMSEPATTTTASTTAPTPASTTSTNSQPMSRQQRALRKMQELRTDSPAMLQSLDTLSTFYDASENNSDSRRNLRFDLESRGLAIAKDFMTRFENVKNIIDRVSDNVDSIDTRCNELLTSLGENEERAKIFVDAVSRLEGQREEAQARAEAIDEFLQRFKLSETQKLAVTNGPTENTNEFLSTLKHISLIRSECQTLLGSQYQRAGMEILEEMTALQDKAQNMLCTYVNEQCSCLEDESVEPSDSLVMSFEALVTAPAYLEICRETLLKTRREAIVRRFVLALVQGGGERGQRPMDMQAHDPVRYTGDIMAWIHQSAVFEKDAMALSFPFNSDGISINSVSSSEASGEWTTLAGSVSAVLEGLRDVLATKIEQVLAVSPPIGDTLRVLNLIGFYRETIAQVLHSPPKPRSPSKRPTHTVNQSAGVMVEHEAEAETDIAGVKAQGTEVIELRFLSTMDAIAELTRRVLFASVNSLTDKLLSSLPSYPTSLAAAVEVLEVVRRLTDVLGVQKQSMMAADTTIAASREGSSKGIQSQNADTDSLLDAFLEPILRVCQRPMTGLSASDNAIFVINNIVAVQVAIARFERTAAWVQRLSSDVSDRIDTLVMEQASAVLQQSGMNEKLDILDSSLSSPEKSKVVPLSTLPGMDVATITNTFHKFYQSLYSLVMPQFDQLSSPRLRVQARNSTSLLIAQAHARLYQAVADPVNRFGATSDILMHTPEAVKTLLNP